MKNFTKIDIDSWSRGKLFRHYIEDIRIVTSLTVDINVAPLVAYTKANRLMFYPTMIWVVSKILNSHNEFKYSWNEHGELIRWDFVSPSYTVFNAEDEIFTNFVTEYSEDLLDFHQRSLADQEKFSNERGICDDQPPNFFNISCIPWVKYRHIDFHVFNEGKFLAPVVTWGKYEFEGEKAMMPLSVNIHHAVADGFHLSRFFNETQEFINSFATSLKN